MASERNYLIIILKTDISWGWFVNSEKIIMNLGLWVSLINMKVGNEYIMLRWKKSFFGQLNFFIVQCFKLLEFLFWLIVLASGWGLEGNGLKPLQLQATFDPRLPQKRHYRFPAWKKCHHDKVLLNASKNVWFISQHLKKLGCCNTKVTTLLYWHQLSNWN